MLPFARDQFLEVFVAYNAHIWPAQIIAHVAGIFVAVTFMSNRAAWSKWGAVALAAMWAWTGVAYHWLHFAPINPAAGAFAVAFVVEAVLLVRLGEAAPDRGSPIARGLAWVFIVYSFAIYEIVGLLSGHAPGALPMFGVAPCPLVLFTLGALALHGRTGWAVWVVPVAWSLIGGSAALLLGIVQDWPLLSAGGLMVLALRVRGRDPAGAGNHPRQCLPWTNKKGPGKPD